MSVSINNLFNYSRSLPPPFDTVTNKRVKVASMYGEKTESTLCGFRHQGSTRLVPVHERNWRRGCGMIDANKSVAEYKSSVGPDAYHLVVFDASTGSDCLPACYVKNTEMIEQYACASQSAVGTAIFFAFNAAPAV